MRQINHLLAVIEVMFLRNDHAIRDNVIYARHCRRARIAQVTHLHRRGPVEQDLPPVLAGIAIEIDQDVDFELTDRAGNLGIAHGMSVHEPVKRAGDAPAHGASVVGSDRNSGHIETGSVVLL